MIGMDSRRKLIKREEKDDAYAMPDAVPLVERGVPSKDLNEDTLPSNSHVMLRHKQEQWFSV